MPIYEYECSACGYRFERLQRFSDPAVDICPHCGERRVQKLLSPPAIQFKGSGWYITDYARKGNGAGAGAKPETSSDAKDTKSSGEKTDSKDSKSPSSDATPSSSPSTDSTKSTS